MNNSIFHNLKKFARFVSLKEHASHIYEFDNVVVIEKNDGKWGVISNQGDEIVPFGKYDLIEPFFMGLARVKIGTVAVGKSDNYGKYRWGIINLSGEEVIPVEYTELWQFHLKQKTIIRMAKGAEYHWLNLYDIATYPYNIKTDSNGHIMDAEYYDQLREDYRIDDISDAFDGNPDALWNID
ncbi:MAG: WG repeat-containing protein [Muribaculaceae bacterium]|nr:WG repeat-containing protein [Muribaculaceae bacterium]